MTLREKLVAYSKVSPDGCWEWQRAKLPAGYGQISIGRQRQDYAHRVSYQIFHGEIPNGMVVRHRCDNPSCCNPEHLEVGTQKDNMRDCKSRGRMVMPPVQRGAANHKTKLTEDDVDFILKSELPLAELAVMFNVTTQAIRWRKNNGSLRS